MADFSLDVQLSGPIGDPVALAGLWHDRIVAEYIQAANETYQGSQTDAPVLSGDLKGSGHIEPEIYGIGEFHIDVVYGSEETTKTDYSYSEASATTNYPAGDMEVDNYPLLVELGHLSRAGNPVAAQPFLGPNFDKGVDDLLMNLEGLLDK